MRPLLVVLGMALVGCDDSPSQPDARLADATPMAETEIDVTGTVIDGVTGTPVAGASISIPNRNVNATSDANGIYSFRLTTSGFASYLFIRVVKTGYLDTFFWPELLVADVNALKLPVLSGTQRDGIYGAAGRSPDASKLFVRVEVHDGAAGPVAGANLESMPSAASTVATDASGAGYLLDAPLSFKVKASQGGTSVTSYVHDAYEQNGQLVVARVALP